MCKKYATPRCTSPPLFRQVLFDSNRGSPWDICPTFEKSV
jgi:hypothetical protein